MIKLTKENIKGLVEKAPQRKNVSTWNNEVKNYAVDLIDDLPEEYYFICEVPQNLEKELRILKK